MIININKLLTSRKSIFNALHNDIRNGRLSKSTGPLEVWKLSDGRLLVVDGYHRLVEAMLKGKKYLNVEVVGEGYTDYWATPNDDVFMFDNYSQYLGLEGLADETILRSAIGSASSNKIDALEAGLKEKYKGVFEPFSSNGSPQFDLISTTVSNAFELKLIVIKKSEQGKGYGGRIMNEIIDFADKNDMIIVLSPSEIKTAKLIKWYKSFDFVENRNRNKDFRFMNRMIRYPKGMTRSKWIDAEQSTTASPKKYDHINFVPPAGVVEEAIKGLEWRKKYGRGGTIVGVQRATTLKNKENISPDTIRRMVNFFSRHGFNEGKNLDDNNEPTPWRIAWALWGGNAGRSWSNKVLKQMEAADKKAEGFLNPVSKYNLIEYGANEFSQEQLDAFDKKPTVSNVEWPPEWYGFGVTDEDLAYIYAVADNFTDFLTDEMLEDFYGKLYRKSEFHEQEHSGRCLFWTTDESVADKFDGKMRTVEYSGKAWLISKYMDANHSRLAKIKHELGGENQPELEELLATGLAYNASEKGVVIVPNRFIKKEDTSTTSRQRSGEKLNLKQALEIRENQYRSRDAQYDYQPEEVDDRINFLLSRLDEREQKKFEKQMEDMLEMPEQAAAKLVLKDYTAYSKLVADAFAAAPQMDNSMVGSYKALSEHNEKMFIKLLTQFEIKFQDEDSYKSFKQLKKEVENTGLLKVFKGGESHPVFTDEENWKFRAVHDLLGHLSGTGHSFSLRGEIAAYNQHLKILPKAAVPALFTEVVGQVCFYYVNKAYPQQKVCRLYGFDFEHIGKVDEEEYKKNFIAAASVSIKNALDMSRDDVRLLEEAINLVEDSGIDTAGQDMEFIALDSNKVVGVVTCENGGGFVSIMIAEGYQGKGIGESLVRTLLSKAKRENYEFLIANPINSASKGLFTKIGFKKRGKSDDLFMSEEDIKATGNLEDVQDSYRYLMGNHHIEDNSNKRPYNGCPVTMANREMKFKLSTIPGQRKAIIDLLEELSDDGGVEIGRIYKSNANGESILEVHILNAEDKAYDEIMKYLGLYKQMGDKYEMEFDKEIKEKAAAASLVDETTEDVHRMLDIRVDGDLEEFEIVNRIDKAKIKEFWPKDLEKILRLHGETFFNHSERGPVGEDEALDLLYKLGTPYVLSHRGRLYAIDGQHRINTAILVGSPLDISIVDGSGWDFITDGYKFPEINSEIPSSAVYPVSEQTEKPTINYRMVR